MDSYSLLPIGFISSCFKEKFGIPRQPGLVSAATATLELADEFREESVRGLLEFSHIWVHFIFHETLQQGWKAMVRPPRLGGNKKLGVFATRSMFRPNPLGLSVVRLDDIQITSGNVMLRLSGCDLMEGTPVLDIKPYLPYADAMADARAGFAGTPPEKTMRVVLTKEAENQVQQATNRTGQDVRLLIEQILRLDPRPSYQINESDTQRVYSMKLFDFDLKWQYCENDKIRVTGLA